MAGSPKNPVDPDKMTVNALKAELKRRGLKFKSRDLKAALQQKLRDAIAAESSSDSQPKSTNTTPHKKKRTPFVPLKRKKTKRRSKSSKSPSIDKEPSNDPDKEPDPEAGKKVSFKPIAVTLQPDPNPDFEIGPVPPHIEQLISRNRVMDFQMVVAGYVRKECIRPIPEVLIRLCTNYFGNTMIWNFHREDMRDFLMSIHGQPLYSRKFRISNVVFQCSLMPNEYDESQPGFVGMKLWLKKVESGRHLVRSNHPIYSKNIRVKYELYCHQTDDHGTPSQTWRDQGEKEWKRKNYHTLSHFQHPIDFDAANSVIAHKKFYDLTVAEERLRAECTNASLCFGCYIEIEQVKKKKRKKKVQKPDIDDKGLGAMDLTNPKKL